MSVEVVSPVWVWRREHRGERDRSYSTHGVGPGQRPSFAEGYSIVLVERGEVISRALALSLGLLDDPPAPRAGDVSFFVLPAPMERMEARQRADSPGR